jgi:hypothetical protein
MMIMNRQETCIECIFRFRWTYQVEALRRDTLKSRGRLQGGT